MGERELPKKPNKPKPVARLTIKPALGESLSFETFDCSLPFFTMKEKTILGHKVFDKFLFDVESGELSVSTIPPVPSVLTGFLEFIEGEPILDSVTLSVGKNEVQMAE